MSSLKALREKIDSLARRLVDLLNLRARTATRIGKIKDAGQAPVFVPAREQEVLRPVK